MGPKAVNTVRIDGDVAYISLTRGYEAIIDVSDIDLVVANGPWHASGRLRRNSPGNIYVARDHKGKPPPRLLHRLLINAPDGMQVDHINHNAMDCRRSNLRVCTNEENARNARGPNSRSTSGVRGVYWHRQAQRWHGQVRANGRRYSAGLYTTLGEAEQAVRAMRKQLHGEFAV